MGRITRVVKLWLDDDRRPPSGWVWVKSAKKAIELLATGEVAVVSLDNDLGEKQDEGKIVLNWLEEQVFAHGFSPPKVYIHTWNMANYKWMKEVAAKINAKITDETISGL